VTGGLDGEVLQRYCHVYRQGELEQLVAMLPWLEVVDVGYDTGNWAMTIRKTAAIPPDYDDRFAALALRKE